MNCKELTNDLLLDYADWQLAPHERNRVARHLDVCEPCRVRRDELEGMSGALRHSTEAPPAALMTQLDKAVLETFPRSRPPVPVLPPRRRLWPLAAAGVAALLLLGLAALIAGRHTDRPAAPPTAVRAPRPAPVVDPAPEPPAEPAIAQPAPRRPEPRVAPVPPPTRETPAPPPPLIARQPDAPAPPPPPAPKRGDLNGDGIVDIADARLLQQRLTQGLPLPALADVNGDGVVDIADVREILRVELAAR